MSDTITLTIEEIRAAREHRLPCDKFLAWDSSPLKCGKDPQPLYCHLCRKLTQAAEGEEE